MSATPPRWGVVVTGTRRAPWWGRGPRPNRASAPASPVVAPPAAALVGQWDFSNADQSGTFVVGFE